MNSNSTIRGKNRYGFSSQLSNFILQSAKGYNLLLLQKIDSDDFYGDWFILENHPSHLAPTDKSGPFALNFNEIEQAIIDIHAMSYINSTLKPLSVQLLYDFVNECIDHDKYKI